MPKRSLAEELDRALTTLLATPGATPQSTDPELLSLLNLAAELRQLPREGFKDHLRDELKRSAMTTTTQEMTATRTTVAPRMTFKDAAKAIEFYQRAFGAKERMRFQTEHSVPHAEIMIEDSVIMLAEEWPEGGRYSAETLGNSPVWIALDVSDVDGFVRRAVSAGARLTKPPTDQFYGRRDAILVDPFGYVWSVSARIEEITVEEMHRRFREMMKEGEPKKGVSPVPKGYSTVTPYLVAADGPALMEFVKQAFGAEEIFRTTGSAGGLHGEVRIGDSMLMIGGGVPGQEFRSTPHRQAIHLYVPDCDAAYRRALEAGATSLDEPRDQEYGERSASVKDLAGNFWYIATHRGETYALKGLNSVNVYLHPLRAEPVIRFLQQAFGARELAKHASPDGVVHHAEIRVGDSVVEMGEAHGKYEPMPAMFYVYVPDCDSVYRRALAAGASSVAEPTDHPYGDRSGAVKDAFGNEWWIATHVKDVSG